MPPRHEKVQKIGDSERLGSSRRKEGGGSVSPKTDRSKVILREEAAAAWDLPESTTPGMTWEKREGP